MINLFIDLDNVLTAFDDAVRNIGGKSGLDDNAPEKDKLLMYKKINEAGEKFWSGMKWTKDGKKLWRFFSKYKPTLLSSPGEFIGAESGKIMWVKNNMPGTKLFLEQDKYIYAERDAILIDDMEKNIEAWKENGGLGILYTGLDDAKKQFKSLLDKNVLKKSSLYDITLKLAKIIISRDLNEDIKILEILKEFLKNYKDSYFIPTKARHESLTFTDLGKEKIEEFFSSHKDIINSGKSGRPTFNFLYLVGQFLTTIGMKIESMLFYSFDPFIEKAYKDLCDVWCRGEELESKRKKLNAGSLMARLKGASTDKAVHELLGMIDKSYRPLKDIIDISLKNYNESLPNSHK